MGYLDILEITQNRQFTQGRYVSRLFCFFLFLSTHKIKSDTVTIDCRRFPHSCSTEINTKHFERSYQPEWRLSDNELLRRASKSRAAVSGQREPSCSCIMVMTLFSFEDVWRLRIWLSKIQPGVKFPQKGLRCVATETFDITSGTQV